MIFSGTSTTSTDMWEQYRKTLIGTQLFILSICALMVYRRVPIGGVAVFFVVMQLGAVIGARWAARLKRKIIESKQGKDDLPLRPR